MYKTFFISSTFSSKKQEYWAVVFQSRMFLKYCRFCADVFNKKYQCHLPWWLLWKELWCFSEALFLDAKVSTKHRMSSNFQLLPCIVLILCSLICFIKASQSGACSRWCYINCMKCMKMLEPTHYWRVLFSAPRGTLIRSWSLSYSKVESSIQYTLWHSAKWIISIECTLWAYT